MTFQLIDAREAVAPVSRLCQCLGVSVRGYHAWKARKPSLRQKTDMVLLAHIRSHSKASGETHGGPRMHAELTAHGVAAGRHRIARLMRDNDLKAHQKRRYKPKGSASKIALGRYLDGFHDPIRRHSALGFQSPCAFEAAA